MAAIAVLFIAAGCADSSSDTSDDIPENRHNEVTEPVDVSDPPSCSELYAEGVRTNADNSATEQGAYCMNGAQRELVESTVQDCADGRTVVFNAWGWGFDGEPWHATSGSVSSTVTTPPACISPTDTT